MSDFYSAPVVPNLRDYFAAHAPKHPEDWFEYDHPSQRPAQPDGAAWCAGCRDASDCDGSNACLLMQEYDAALESWRSNLKRAQSIAWRWAWADAMIEGRGQ